MQNSNYIRRENDKIVAGNGLPEFRRGMGLGGWLLPEGYMWEFEGEVNSPLRMEKLVRDILGPDAAGEFWQKYLDRFITERDIEAIAHAGFDHVRLPLNSRTIMEDGHLSESAGKRIDTLVEWCKASGITVVLDLHGAPGGQTGANIDDSPNRKPELFTDPKNFDAGLQLWSDLAARYASEPWVAGYDILNEPLPDQNDNGSLIPELNRFHREAVKTIRKVDSWHLLSIEGWHWSTRFDGLDLDLDRNSVLHFHKYWSTPDTSSIEPYLTMRRETGLPLWMGESGENTNDWYREAFNLFESHNIPWTFWTWKKLARTNSPATITKPQNWELLEAAAQDPTLAINREKAAQALWTFIDNLALEHCSINAGVLESLPGISA